MTAVALVAILVAVAIPSYQSLRQEQMVRATHPAIHTDMMLLVPETVKTQQESLLNVFNSGLATGCYRIAIDGSCTSCTDNCSSLEGRKGPMPAISRDYF